MLGQIQRFFAVFSLLLFLQAVFPGAVFSADLGVKSQNSQSTNPLAEEEEDEHSDVNLKIFCEEQDLALDIAHYSLPVGSDVIPPGYILEIPTPPPLA